MRAFRHHFKKPHTFLPVIHAEKRDQVLRNVDMATCNGADGVFLINHGSMDADELIEYYHAARERYPAVWIGLNMLGVRNTKAIEMMPEYDCALWTDNAGITDVSDAEAHHFKRVANASSWRGMYFGGVAFKYQKPVIDLVTVAKRAMGLVDVITTSGDATGSPPAVEKIANMRSAVGSDAAIAIASGMTHRNVLEYRDADCFLVASSLLAEHSFTEFDELKLLRFADAMRQMNERAMAA